MKKVLIIEDDTQLQSLYKENLEKIADVSAALTGADGIQQARDRMPDLIILDIMLPSGMNGFDVLRELKADEKLKSIPVLVLTNLDSEQKAAKDMGAVDYIVKANASMEEVASRVKSFLGV